MTLKFSGFPAAAKIHVCARFHPAECSGSWVMASWQRKKLRRTYGPSLPRGQ